MIKKFGYTKLYYTALSFILGSGLSFWAAFSNEKLYIEHGSKLTIAAVFFGVIIPFYLFMRIKCPKCGCKFFWIWFNGGKDLDKSFNPFSSDSCPVCGHH